MTPNCPHCGEEVHAIHGLPDYDYEKDTVRTIITSASMTIPIEYELYPCGCRVDAIFRNERGEVTFQAPVRMTPELRRIQEALGLRD